MRSLVAILFLLSGCAPPDVLRVIVHLLQRGDRRKSHIFQVEIAAPCADSPRRGDEHL